MFRKTIYILSIIIVFILILFVFTYYVTDGSADKFALKSGELFKKVGQTFSSQNSSNDSKALAEEYNNTGSRYSIRYPVDWSYDDKSTKGAVIFRGKEGTSAFLATVNIQTVLTKQTGGKFSTAKAFMADLKSQAEQQPLKAKFLEKGPIVFNMPNGTKVSGEYLILTYQFNNFDFKQWQIVVLRNDNQVFYAWAYTAPANQYDDSLAIAKSMLESWIIY